MTGIIAVPEKNGQSAVANLRVHFSADFDTRPTIAIHIALALNNVNAAFRIVHLLLRQVGGEALNTKLFECNFLFCHELVESLSVKIISD